MTESPGPEIPALVEFPPDTKAMVISALKLVLRRMRESGILTAPMSYNDLLGMPVALHNVIRLYKRHRDIARDVTVDAKGGPVQDDHAELVCGITLAQVERLLVFTCAKRVFAAAGQAWQGSVRPGALVPDEVKRILAFDWQLPLLEIYRDAMTVEHFRVLGDAILTLRTAEAVATVASLNPIDLARLKATLDTDLGILFAGAEPAPTDGKVAEAPPPPPPPAAERIEADADPTAGQVGPPAAAPEPPVMPDLQPEPRAEAVDPLQDLPPSIREPLLSAFHDTFGADGDKILRDPGFTAEILPGIVAQARRRAETGESGLEEWARREWSQLRPRILLWMRVRTAR